jgi:hypothetical protein
MQHEIFGDLYLLPFIGFPLWPRVNWELVRGFQGLNLLIPSVNPTEQLSLQACCDHCREGTML